VDGHAGLTFCNSDQLGLFRVSLSQSNPWAVAIFVDEFDAGQLKRPAARLVRDLVRRQAPRGCSHHTKNLLS
jgi:hypothetical protein